MDYSTSWSYNSSSMFLVTVLLLLIIQGGAAATFKVINKCGFTVWPGILGSPQLDTTGFELRQGGSRSLQVPTGWSGRVWGRTGCSFDSATGQGSCSTADCNSGNVECKGATATPPATLAEFTLGSQGSLDYYDVSLVDGYNLPMIVEVIGGSAGSCKSTGCLEDINRLCPAELRVEGGIACRSACDAFGKPEYCCQGAFASPATCKPSQYAQIFKNACPKSYSYAYDDATSTFTCSAAGYTITFCPNSASLKSARDSSSQNPAFGSGSAIGTSTNDYPDSWLVDLATGDAPIAGSPLSVIRLTIIVAISILCC